MSNITILQDHRYMIYVPFSSLKKQYKSSVVEVLYIFLGSSGDGRHDD